MDQAASGNHIKQRSYPLIPLRLARRVPTFESPINYQLQLHKNYRAIQSGHDEYPFRRPIRTLCQPTNTVSLRISVYIFLTKHDVEFSL